MKFKLFRKKESSNSIKVLLKKLKRHDTKVVAVAVIIALFLSGGLIYISTPIVATTATEEIAESGRQSSKETTEKLNEINKYLTELDKVVTNNQKSLNTITQNSGYTSSKETIDATGKTTNTISEKVTTLGGSLKEVHTTIESTTSKIEELNKALEKNDTTNKQQLEKDFAQVNQDLAKINTQYEEAKKQNKELIEKLQKDMTDGDKKLGDSSTENHKALLKELETMDKSMEEKNTKTIETFQGDIAKLSESMDKQLEVINTSVNTMNSSMNSGLGELKEYVGNVAGGINGRLDQVFQSVSDGKKLLASTLLTKGIVIAEDATFQEISKAIMDIPTTITVQEMTGTVVYDKHFHTDGKGTECNEHHVSIDRMGGCYNKPYYHVHDSSCYRTSISYSYYTKQETYVQHWARDENGIAIFRYECRNCHSSFESPDGEHLEYASTYDQARRRDGTGIKEHVNQVLVCGKNGSTLEGYSCSCGYLHGQILAAHIDYSMNKNLKSLPDLEQSHMAVQAPGAGKALDTLMLLTDVDMSAGGKDITLEKEFSGSENVSVAEPEGKENSNQAGNIASLEENADGKNAGDKAQGDKAAGDTDADNTETTNKESGNMNESDSSKQSNKDMPGNIGKDNNPEQSTNTVLNVGGSSFAENSENEEQKKQNSNTSTEGNTNADNTLQDNIAQ